VQELLGKGYLNMVRGTIDYKAGQLIHYSVSRIIAQAFDEHDILVLLILLREHALANSPVRELGDFVAHRVRNRGPFLQFLRNLSPEFEKPSIPKGQGATDTLLTSIQFDKILSTPAIYSQSDILSSLNDILQPAGFQTLPNDLAGDIIVCIMSLLQDARFVDEHKAEVGKLLFLISKTKVAIGGTIRMPNDDPLAVTMLSTDNRYYPFEPRTPQEIGIISDSNSVITVVRRSGVLHCEFMPFEFR
jgi:hypothetical protein